MTESTALRRGRQSPCAEDARAAKTLRAVDLHYEQNDIRRAEDRTALLREAERFTEQRREARARRHAAIARASADHAERLHDLAEATGSLDGVQRAKERPCPKCGARPGDPCTSRGVPIKALHPDRVGLRELAARQIWHERRGRGAETRYKKVGSCGAEVIAIRCTSCGDRSSVRAIGCGVARLCPDCSIRKARTRQADFGRARGRVILRALHNVSGRGPIAGPAARWRKGGRYTDKMLTLTIPHVDGKELWFRALDRAQDDPNIADSLKRLIGQGSSTISARIAILFAAWPIFWRSLRADLKRRGLNDHDETLFDRFFEWTPAADEMGHPHFHVWLWSPWICADRVSELWTRALRKLGMPVTTKRVICTSAHCAHCKGAHYVGARSWIQHMKDFDAKAVRELMKSGDRRKAIELAKFAPEGRSHSRADVHEYAGGWAVSDVIDLVDGATLGELDLALEGRRLAQGSAGLYADDAPPCCASCGCVGTRVAVTWSAADTAKTNAWNKTVAKTKPPLTELALGTG